MLVFYLLSHLPVRHSMHISPILWYIIHIIVYHPYQTICLNNYLNSSSNSINNNNNKVPTTPATTRVITVLLIVKNTSLVCFDRSVHITPSLKYRNIQYRKKKLYNTRMLSYCCSIYYHRYRLHKTIFIYFNPVITEKNILLKNTGHMTSYLEMGRKRYRVLKYRLSGHFQIIGIAKKSDSDTE